MAAIQAGHLELQKYVQSHQLHRCVLKPYSVRHLVLDEADRLLDAEFVEQVEEIVAACSHPNIQRAVFSATLPTGVERAAMKMLHDPIRVVVGLKYVSGCF